ncbi:hypothetical protein GCM10008018_14300 [Paenibacillus marchantiophytorum]|uniref:Uncharacterized protein n=1 Tax=Paenibacillus marchantiophytorum TaxID=1619310 RepID=A0ABQ2BRH0_9BACL|nr:hypothetical protein GCM10008018_14300 [Paenibacillus marchantiophytorum]
MQIKPFNLALSDTSKGLYNDDDIMRIKPIAIYKRVLMCYYFVSLSVAGFLTLIETHFKQRMG